MNFRTHKILIVLVSLIFAINTQAQKKPNYITLHEIKSKLIALTFKKTPKDEVSKQLQEEIQKRKVDFVLLMEDRVFLKEVGGDDLLINAIRNNTLENAGKLLKEYEEELKELEESKIIYQKYLDNYKGNLAQIKIAIEAGKEFLRKFGDNVHFTLQSDYLKRAVPKLEERVKREQQFVN